MVMVILPLVVEMIVLVAMRVHKLISMLVIIGLVAFVNMMVVISTIRMTTQRGLEEYTRPLSASPQHAASRAGDLPVANETPKMENDTIVEAQQVRQKSNK